MFLRSVSRLQLRLDQHHALPNYGRNRKKTRLYRPPFVLPTQTKSKKQNSKQQITTTASTRLLEGNFLKGNFLVSWAPTRRTLARCNVRDAVEIRRLTRSAFVRCKIKRASTVIPDSAPLPIGQEEKLRHTRRAEPTLKALARVQSEELLSDSSCFEGTKLDSSF